MQESNVVKGLKLREVQQQKDKSSNYKSHVKDTKKEHSRKLWSNEQNYINKQGWQPYFGKSSFTNEETNEVRNKHFI